jgi:hypothetical protein
MEFLCTDRESKIDLAIQGVKLMTLKVLEEQRS